MIKKIVLILLISFSNCGEYIESRAKKDSGFVELDNTAVLALLYASEQAKVRNTVSLPNCQTGTNASLSNAVSSSNAKFLNYNEDFSFTVPATSTFSVLTYCGFTFDPRNKTSIQLSMRSSSRASFSILVSTSVINLTSQAGFSSFATFTSTESSATISNINPPVSTTSPWYIYLVQSSSTNCSSNCSYTVRLTSN
jgi:hypothetical protein